MNKTGFKFFDIIRDIDTPLYIIFFVLTGDYLELGLINSMGVIGLIYIVSRIYGKMLGVYTSCSIINAPPKIKNIWVRLLLRRQG